MNEQLKGVFEIQYHQPNFPTGDIFGQMNDFIDSTLIQHGFEVHKKWNIQAPYSDDPNDRELGIEFRCRADREWYEEASTDLMEVVLDGLDDMFEGLDIELDGASSRLLA